VGEKGQQGETVRARSLPWSPMMQEDSQTETGAETFLELLGARVRNPDTRSAYRVAWRAFLAFCSARQLELESVNAYHVGAWLDQHPGSRSTQRQHLAAVRLLFDSLMMRRVVEYNPAARAKPPRLVRGRPSVRTCGAIRFLPIFLPLGADTDNCSDLSMKFQAVIAILSGQPQLHPIAI
jgi:site-specific recombinase XerD